jgi:hypothetical protein
MRVLGSLVAIALLAGCQSQSPFAAFGPPTVPAPTTSQAPYYPPSATVPQRGGSSAAATPQRMSVSAEAPAPAPQLRGTILAEAGDREPIRVVENPQASARTAAAANRGPAPTNSPLPTPNATSPAAIQSAPAAPPQSGYAPSGRSSAFNRTRGFLTVQPASGNITGGTRADSAVIPASYQQPGTAGFTEAPPASGQWRAR